MASANPSTHSTERVRRALGRIRRSDAVSRATGFFGVQRRRVQQRLRSCFVRGVHLRTTDYFDHAPTSEHGRYYPVLGLAGRIKISGPTFILEPPTDKIGSSITTTSGPHGIAELSWPWVVGRSGAVVGCDRKLLWDLSYEWPGQPQHHTTYSLMDVPSSDVPGTTVTIAAMGADGNYFHFLLNSVARLVYLQKTVSAFKPDRFLISGPVTDFAADALALFDIARERLIGTSDFPAIRAERLIAPPLVQHPFVVPAHVCEFVRTRVHSKLPPRAAVRRRILIDRSDAPTRRIANLTELRPILEKFGVESVRLTGLSMAEQAQLFRDAELVIGNHGAALSNLVFCDPGTRVLQILAPGMMEREYRTVSQHGRLVHDYLVGEFATSQDESLALKQRDLVLPPRILSDVLTAAVATV